MDVPAAFFYQIKYLYQEYFIIRMLRYNNVFCRQNIDIHFHRMTGR